MDRDFLETLKNRHADNFGWALACCRWRQAEAEDVLQEAYLKVLDGRARFNGRASARTWFFSVIKRTASEFARKRVRRNVLDQTLDPHDATAPEQPDHLIERSDETRRLLAALNQLPDRQREVLHLVFLFRCNP